MPLCLDIDNFNRDVLISNSTPGTSQPEPTASGPQESAPTHALLAGKLLFPLRHMIPGWLFPWVVEGFLCAAHEESLAAGRIVPFPTHLVPLVPIHQAPGGSPGKP